MALTFSSKDIDTAAHTLAASESDYYSYKGPASTTRLLRNLAETMFWTERLMGIMAKLRWTHMAWATTAVLAVLVGTLIVQPAAGAFLVLKILGSAVALLVALDIFGEAQSFERGEREISKLLSAVTAEFARTEPSRDEGVRLLIEYNCLLADLPLLPDEVYHRNREILNTAWSEFEKAIPISTKDARQ